MSSKQEDFEKRAFISGVLVGPCVLCQSENTHDCGAEDNECPIAKSLDDIAVNHCEDCNALWCDGCGKIISSKDVPIDKLGRVVEKHWSAHDKTEKEINFVHSGEDETGSKLFCNACNRKVDEWWCPNTLNESYSNLFECILLETNPDAAYLDEEAKLTPTLCDGCSYQFEDRLRTLLKGKPFQIKRSL